MSAAVKLTRLEYGASELRTIAARSSDAAQTRRLLAIALVLEGASRLEAARQTGMDRQTLRDWVHRYNESGVDGLVSRTPPGPTPKLTPTQMQALYHLVIAGPDLAVHQVIRWRCVNLRDEVTRRFGVTVDEDTIGRWLRKLRLTRLQPRPFHPKKDAAAQEAFKERARLGGPAMAVETGHAILNRRGAAEGFLVDLTPKKNVAHGLLRTCEW
jgi:transposase